MSIFRRKGKKGRGFSPFWAGVIALVIVVVGTFFGYTKYNPFARPFELTAVFESANNLKPRSPVRIAGVNVGEVTTVEPIPGGRGAARVKMKMQNEGLPIHEDAELKIRPRIFLEGNFFVDVQPGSPSSPVLKKKGVIPMNQTATPVQFGQVLTALQTDVREDLQTFLREYAVNGLGGGAAEAFNRSIPYWEPAYRNTALVNRALLGSEEGDLQRLLRGQARTLGALARHPESLKDLITNFNRTAAAFAREDDSLQASIPALRDVLRVGSPALLSLNRSLPSLRAFARDALPGVRSSRPTIDASLPTIRQLRLLFREEELRGLTRDLRPTIPALARLNRRTIPFLSENRALSSCQNRVLLPFARTPIPDPDFPRNSGQPFYKEAPRGLVGLAGESRGADANGQSFRVQFLGGLDTIVSSTDSGETAIGQAGLPITGTRPARPREHTVDGVQTERPVFRPRTPCETQEPPDLNAPRGEGEAATALSPDITVEQLLDLIRDTLPFPKDRKMTEQERIETFFPGEGDTAEEVERHMFRRLRGLPSVDPLSFNEEGERREARRLGLKREPDGSLTEVLPEDVLSTGKPLRDLVSP